MDRVILKAGEGMVLTDGRIFGKTIYLANGRKKEEFYSISEEEYEKKQGGDGCEREDCLD